MIGDRNNVLIIGNGFDLDLGLHTTYRDFMKSSWPFTEETEGLAKFLKDKFKLNDEKWIDFEHCFVQYIVGNRFPDDYKMDKEKDYAQHTELQDALMKYLAAEELKEIKQDSVAARVAKIIAENNTFSKVFTFNYTSFDNTLKKLGAKFNHEIEYIHGSIEDGHIILGAGDNSKIREEYDFLYKSYSPHYRSHNIPFALREANMVVIFGHSFGYSDRHYFEKFLIDQSRPGMERKDSKHIFIFTKDVKTRREFLRIIRNMLGDNYQYLWANNTVNIVHTDNSDEEQLQEVLKYLKTNSFANKYPVSMPMVY